MKIIFRLKQFIDYKNINYSQFEKSIGASNAYIAKQVRNSGSIGSELIVKIHEVYPELNLYWLFTGAGPMILPPGFDITNLEPYINRIKELENQLALKDELLKVYEKRFK